MFKGHQRTVAGPWVGMARHDGREWFRDHPGAPLAEFDEWVRGSYEPYVLRSYEYVGGSLTTQLRDVLDDVHLGLGQAARDETGRRAFQLA